MPDGGKSLRKTPRHKRNGMRVGVWVFLALLLSSAISLWFLNDYFPGSLSSWGDQMSFVHGISLLALISSGLLATRQINFGETVRNISIWIGVAAALILGYSFQEEIKMAGTRVLSELLPARPVVTAEGVITLIKGDDGQFHASGLANGTTVRFLVDTGATGISLSPDDARRLGVDLATLEYSLFFETANGIGRGARWRLDSLSIGPIEFRDVTVSINKEDVNSSLLGMSFLGRLASFEVSGRKMTLRQ
ncbi:MAG: TIGR02281 family clan AA aspartic protease [Alphaproteobacteria bacterium]|jgi:aspartyl protease family protein|nr:TIGR02281 family clan AA aspartic protease [Alphaproteobacteria bacterium]